MRNNRANFDRVEHRCRTARPRAGAWTPSPRHLVGRAVAKGAEGSSVASDTLSAEAIHDHLAKMSLEARVAFLIKISHLNPQQLTLAR